MSIYQDTKRRKQYRAYTKHELINLVIGYEDGMNREKEALKEEKAECAFTKDLLAQEQTRVKEMSARVTDTTREADAIKRISTRQGLRLDTLEMENRRLRKQLVALRILHDRLVDDLIPESSAREIVKEAMKVADKMIDGTLADIRKSSDKNFIDHTAKEKANVEVSR